MDIVVVVEVMIKLLAVMILGFFLSRIDVLDREVSKKLSWMVVNVTSPLLVIYSVFEVTVQDRSIVWNTLLIGICCYLSFILAAFVLSRLLRIPRGSRGIFQFMLVFANTGFMGYPVLQSLFGTEAIFYASIYGIPFNLLVYTYGVSIIRNDRVGTDTPQEREKFRWKSLINVGTISSVVAIVLFLTAFPLPDVVVEFCGMVGNTTTPLSMLIIGASLADVSIREMIRDKKLYVLAALRLFAIPFLMYAACTLLHIDSYITGIATVSAAMPAASMAVMMAKSYDGNTDFASKGVVFTTLLCVATLPVVVYVTHLI